MKNVGDSVIYGKIREELLILWNTATKIKNLLESGVNSLFKYFSYRQKSILH